MYWSSCTQQLTFAANSHKKKQQQQQQQQQLLLQTHRQWYCKRRNKKYHCSSRPDPPKYTIMLMRMCNQNSGTKWIHDHNSTEFKTARMLKTKHSGVLPVETTKMLLPLREFICRIQQHHHLKWQECPKPELIKTQWKTYQNH